MVCVFSKVNRLNKKPSQEFRFVMLKGYEKFGQKANSGFQYILPPKLMNFILAGSRVKNVSFLDLIFLKGNLVE